MDVIDRIEIQPASGCPFISLHDDEKEIYQGAGFYLASFSKGTLVDVWGIAGQVPVMDSLDEEAGAILKLALEWLQVQQGQRRTVMAGMFSCFQFCEPEPVPYPDGMARLARFIGDAVAELDLD